MNRKRILWSVLLVCLTAIALTVFSLWYFEDYFLENRWLAIDRHDVQKLKRMASEGSGEACFCLSLYYYKIDEKYNYWQKKAVQYGNSEAQHHMYLKLRRNSETVGKAIELLRKAAEYNNASSQVVLGREYHTGEIMPHDHKQAAYWYHRAIQNGEAIAMYDLSMLLTENRKDFDGLVEAYKWLIIVAEKTSAGEKTYIRNRDLDRQMAIIFNKAAHLGYDKKVLVRRAALKARAEGKDIIVKDIVPDWNKRCKELASGK